ncbi:MULTISPECIES: hypothetical protein [unclassified Haladaptatus]|uniref:hypothetical protein n=1 Tax=unclassified Haladaptatus TaxID=2622732 RepID=UPI0023E7FFB1|nr:MULTISPECIES: hypothetical protein [unclassified Haladaptatus]
MSDAPPASANPDDDLPSTNVTVECHVHFGMTGSFPLRLAELFFADDGLYVAEYAYITPMFGLGTKKHHREAGAMQAIYDHHGLDEVLLQADAVTWHNYENVVSITVYDGGRVGRPKLTIETASGKGHAYRLHDVSNLPSLVADLQSVGDHHGFTVTEKDGVGYSLRESVSRVFE